MSFDQALTRDQIHYLRTVLGVQDFIVPTRISIAGEAPAVSWAATRVTGSLERARLIILAGGRGAEFPLDGDAGDLASKMLQAMKLGASDVMTLQWTNASSAAPPAAATEFAREAKGRPVLVFGEEAARSLLGPGASLGAWSELEGALVMPTHAPRDLLSFPERKRIAWAHLQLVMKRL